MKDDVQLYFGVNCDTDLSEYPFFRNGMLLSEFNKEYEKYSDHMKNGGTLEGYIEILRNR